jgi:hypothetical protein
MFSDNYKLFYNWDNDLIERINKIEVIRVDNIKYFINYKLNIDLSDGLFILSDTINAIAIDVINKKIVYISSLTLEDENNICNLVNNIKITNIKYSIIDKREMDLYLSEESTQLKILIHDIKSGNSSFIKYLYYYIFNKKSNNISLMRTKLIEDISSNNNIKYLNLYKIIYK